MDKYLQQKRVSVFQRLVGVKRRRSPGREEQHTQHKWNRGSY
jgi:hypothetical protein